MKRLFAPSLLSLAFALAACGDEAEDTPDIAEAIPLDPEAGDEGDTGAGEEDAQSPLGDGGEAADAALPSAGDATAGDVVRSRSIPDSMETGSNPPDFAPPKGSKVQRFN